MRATTKNQTLFAVISAMAHPSDHLFINLTEVAIVTIEQRVMAVVSGICSQSPPAK